MDNQNNGNKNGQKLDLFYGLSLGMGLGLAVAVPLVLFLLAGLFLDEKFNTLPLFLIIFILLSLVVAAFEVKKLIMPFLEKREKRSQNKNNNN